MPSADSPMAPHHSSERKASFSPGEGSLLLPHLKVIPKGPVPQHLEECVMVSISAHILQVVVLPSRAHALLAVHHPLVLCQLAPGVHCAQEDGLELEIKAERHPLRLDATQRWRLCLGLLKHRHGARRDEREGSGAVSPRGSPPHRRRPP